MRHLFSFVLIVAGALSGFAQQPPRLAQKLAETFAVKLPEWKPSGEKKPFSPDYQPDAIAAEFKNGNRIAAVRVSLDKSADNAQRMSGMRSFMARSVMPPYRAIPNLGKEAILVSRGNIVEIGVSKAKLFVSVNLTFPETKKISRNVYDQTFAPREEQEIALKIARVVTNAIEGEKTVSPCANDFYYLSFPEAPETLEDKLFAAVANADARMIDAILLETPNLNYHFQNKNSILHFAVKQGCPEFVRKIVQAEADVSAVNEPGETPLMIAAGSRNSEIAQLLISAGADARARDKEGRNAAFYAYSYEHAPRFISSADNSDSEYPAKIENARRAIVRELVAAGLDLSETSPEDKNTILHQLLKYRKPDETYIAELLDAGIDVNAANAENDTALTLAAQFLSDRERNAVIRLLLARGADPNRKNNRDETALSILRRKTEIYRDDPYYLKPTFELINLLKEAGAIE